MTAVYVKYGESEWSAELKEGSNTIGRSSQCTIAVKDTNLSREHCEIKSSEGNWIVYDKGSKNGTIVNGERIIEKILSKGDVIKIGSTTIYFDKKRKIQPVKFYLSEKVIFHIGQIEVAPLSIRY